MLFMADLASGRSRDAATLLSRSAFLGWKRRWICMLLISCSCVRDFPHFWSSRFWTVVDGVAPIWPTCVSREPAAGDSAGCRCGSDCVTPVLSVDGSFISSL